jgi:DNA ligase-1
MIKQPLLAPGEDPLSYSDYFKKLQYPLLASPKYDGIRCISTPGICYSRTMKMLPSLQVQDLFSDPLFAGFDGELIEGSPYDIDVYNRTQSHVMSVDKPGNMSFFVFDTVHPEYIDLPFYERLEVVQNRIQLLRRADIVFVPHVEVNDYDELIAYENKTLELGFEGIMMRNPIGEYKQGRATFRQNIIYKLKRFKDAEAKVIGFNEQMTNNNVLEEDERGYAKRSSSKDGLSPAGTLGNFVCEHQGQIITVAPGAFDHAHRKLIWDNQNQYEGKLLKFRYFAHGIKDLPRFPRALGWRDTIDL